MYIRIYTERGTDGCPGRIRWTTLHIHDLDKVLESSPLKNVLLPQYDNRNSKIDQLSKAQIVRECKNLGLDSSGIKVKRNIKSNVDKEYLTFYIVHFNKTKSIQKKNNLKFFNRTT